MVDAAITDGAASLMTLFYGMHGERHGQDQRASNILDTGAPFGEIYETKDGKYVAILAIEPKFFAELVERMGLDPAIVPLQYDRSQWSGAEGSLRCRLQDQDARRVVRDPRGHGRLLRSACSRSPRRRLIRTTLREKHSSSSTASCSPRPRRD